MTLGERIKEIRKHYKMTQSEFGLLFGLSPSHISNIENNRENPSEMLILFICFRFNINKQWLISGKGDIKESFNVNSKDGCLKKLQEIQLNINERLNKLTSEELKLSVGIYSHILNLLLLGNDCQLTHEEMVSFLKCLFELFKTLDVLLESPILLSSYSCSDLLNFRSEIDDAIESNTHTLKNALTILLNKKNIDLYLTK